MRILKFLAAVSVAVLAAGSLQARRMLILMSKTRGPRGFAAGGSPAGRPSLAAAPKATTPPPAKKKKTTVITAPAVTAPDTTAPATTVNAAAVPSAAAASSGAVSTDAEAKARQQLREAEGQTPAPAPAPADADAAREQHMRELEAARAAKAAAAAPAPVETPAPVVTTPPPAAAPAYRSGGLSPDAEQRAREAMRAASARLDTQPEGECRCNTAARDFDEAQDSSPCSIEPAQTGAGCDQRCSGTGQLSRRDTSAAARDDFEAGAPG